MYSLVLQATADRPYVTGLTTSLESETVNNLPYAKFYRVHGIRLPDQFPNPPLSDKGEFLFPLNSLLHYPSYADPEAMGLTQEFSEQALIKRPIVAKHVTAYIPMGDEPVGRFRNIPMKDITRIMDYHKNNPSIKNAERYANMARQPRNLVVVNYGLVNEKYIYIENREKDYTKWQNEFSTLTHGIKQNFTTGRHQFLFCDVPSIIPPLSVLQRAEKVMTDQFLKIFKTPDMLMVLELWRWLAGIKDSPLAIMNQEELSSLNLVWTVGSNWTVLNLGLLNSWIVREGEEKSATKKLDQGIAQRRFLKFLMQLKQSLTVAHDEQLDYVEEVDVTEDTSYVNDFAEGAIDDGKKALRGITGVKMQQSIKNVKERHNAQKIKVDDKDVDAAFGDETSSEVDDSEIEKDLQAQEKIFNEIIEQKEKVETGSAYQAHVEATPEISTGVKREVDKFAKKGLLTAAEVRRFDKIASKYQTLDNPFGKGTLEQFLKIDPADLKVNKDEPLAEKVSGVIDQNMLYSSMKKMEGTYIKKTMNKDIANVAMSLQRGGYAVQDYQVKRVEDLNDKYDIHSIKIVPVRGKPSTVRFRVPVVEEDGTYMVAGVKYRMRRQRGDKPIRKTGPDEVALTSYYSKMFVNRSSRMTFNYDKWIVNQISKISIEKPELVTEVKFKDVFDREIKLPRTYSSIAREIAAFNIGGYKLNFDIRSILKANPDAIKTLDQFVPIGTNSGGVLYMDFDNNIHRVDVTGKFTNPKMIGRIEDLLGISVDSAPVECAELSLFGKMIPIGFILGHRVGLGNLLATLKVNYRRVAKGSKLTGEDASNTYMVKFSDETLLFDKKDYRSLLIINGLNRFKNDLKQHSVYLFDKPDIYESILASNAIGVRYTREFDTLFKFWIDHITEEFLVKMNEPTNMFDLFVRSVELLTTDQHPDEMDMEFLRDKGYERFAGIAYSEMMKAVRFHSSKPLSSMASLDMNPEAVWFSILQDQTTTPIEQSNPIHSLKEQQVVIFNGSGGRSGKTMMAKSRRFHKSHRGVVSEATVDNGDVGTIFYVAPNANYDSVRGDATPIEESEVDVTKLFSTSFALTPFVDTDDGKRQNFISVQNSQTTFVKNQQAAIVRTGAEKMLAFQTGDTFAKTADGEGKVIAKTDKVLTVEYKDGSVTNHEIGRKYGRWSGYTVPHTIVTPLKLGDKLKKGDVVCYNSNWFDVDRLSPKELIYKGGVLCRAAFVETPQTFEDSSEISKAFAEKMVTEDVTIRTITVDFDQEIRNLVKVGDNVQAGDILCTVHNSMTLDKAAFDEASLSTLEALSRNTPRTDFTGVVEKIEVLYTGELEEMSETLQHLTDKSNAQMYKFNKQMGKRAVDGNIPVGFRVDGIPLGPNMAAVKVYIKGDIPMGIGDKLVYGGQMKSVVGGVFENIVTEDDVPVDAYFSYKSNLARIVTSYELQAVIGAILVKISPEVGKLLTS